MKNSLKFWRKSVLIIAMLLSSFTALTMQSNGNELSKMASKLVLCRMVASDKENVTLYMPIYPAVASGKDCSALIDTLLSSPAPQAYPGVGCFADLAILDKRGRAIAMIHVVCWDSTVVLNRCKTLKEGYAEILDSTRYCEVIARKRDPKFVKEIYNFVKQHDPSRYKRLREFWNRKGHNIEDMLFDGK